MTCCFHCALPIARDTDYTVEIDGGPKAVCCPGCKAVAELIRDSGMAAYYAMRDAPEPGAGRPLDAEHEWRAYNRDDMLEAFATRRGDRCETSVYAGGMYCAACSWLIQSSLARMPGIDGADVNPVTHRLRVTFRPESIGLGDILATLADLGYKPQPLAGDDGERPELAEQRAALKRLLVASIGMMQVMMFAIALYAGEFQGIDAGMQGFLRLVSFVVTTPVVFYSARPFFSAAWRGIRARMPGMDVPVALAIAAAYSASVYATLTNGPAVWYDSVTMFVFFLTLGRFLEMRARHRAVDRGLALAALLPNTVTRLEGRERVVVPVTRLCAGDTVSVGAGESVPADGVLVTGTASVDEALLTGESRPRSKAPGDTLAAGSINLDNPIEMRVSRTGADSTLGTISRLSEQARYARPDFVNLADRLASYIVVAVLGIAAIVAAYWYLRAPERAFVITLSVLVVTCPCALALATPAAFAATGSRLAQLNLLLTNGDAIEVLARATHVLFDKTGTLTRGRPTLVATSVTDPAFDAATCRGIAAALETASNHPLARAFREDAGSYVVEDARVVVGQGIGGTIDGRRWRIGRAGFVAPGTAAVPDSDDVAQGVALGADGRLVAVFTLQDELRADAASTLRDLEALGLSIGVVSGDGETAVRNAATALGVHDFRARCSPEDKLSHIGALRAAGATVIMVGDGVNDAPVLAGADASIAPAHGSMLAQTSADLIMLGELLAPVTTAVRIARKTLRIVRQNLGWAIGYNALALPAAVAGLVPPWLAAIGMSVSSLVVVSNALRLSRFGAPLETSRSSGAAVPTFRTFRT